MSLKMKLRTILYFMTGSYSEYLIRKNKYDVVHINGIGLSSTAYMYACARTNTPFVVTLHGLISFGEVVHAGKYSKRMEREFFKMNANNPFALSTVISTGIKNKLCGVVGKDMHTINVVCNPVIRSNEQIIPKYDKVQDEKIIVTVGNVSLRKNQKLIVDAFSKMCNNQAGKYKLFVIGGNEEELKVYVKNNGIENVVFTGAIERSDVYAYYQIADLCIMASLDEGFGLSLVEGYNFGVPCVMPSSIDAFSDLYDEACCVPAENYEIETFADAMHTALCKEWDREKIRAFSKKFSEENCASEYLKVLKQASEFKSTPFDLETLDKLVKLCVRKDEN